MDLKNLRHLEYKNETAPGFAHLPTTILDAFIPGYSFISKFILDLIGFDISIIVSVLVLGFALNTGSRYLYRHAAAWFLKHFSASVSIDYYDNIYDHVLAWASEQDALRKVRSLRVQTAGESMSDDIDELDDLRDVGIGAIFNFNAWTAKVPPRYEPDTGFHWFWHKGHYFKFQRENEKVAGGFMGMLIQDHEKLTLSVLGRSTKPIKDLILETRDKHLSKQTSKTVVRRPSPKEQRGRGRSAWTKVAVRPSRPMTTVVLDDTQKTKVLEDINEFLHPRTPRWYANRGIPYRRGYLFYGPPGTGKTSLSFALAGVFGLDIYCLSLSEATLTEEDLIMLFNSLPKRCVVLLEDIDSAGVLRKKPDTEDDEKANHKSHGKKGEKESKDEDNDAASSIAKEVARAVKSATDASEASRKGPSLNNQGITMSGLLNAIDGVASQEGRVLVMTTNYPQKLDDALIRPGRVDLKVEFTLASKQQIRELFLRMYCADSREAARQPTMLSQIIPATIARASAREPEVELKSDVLQSAALFADQSPSTKTILPTPPRTPNPEKIIIAAAAGDPQAATDLEDLASRFAGALPDTTFSPAEIQGFLLMRKTDPVRAVEEVAQWRDVELDKRKKKDEAELGKKTIKDGSNEDVKSSEEVADKPAVHMNVGGTKPEGQADEGTDGKKDIQDLKVETGGKKDIQDLKVETGSKSLLGLLEGIADDDCTAPSSASSLSSASSAASLASVQSVESVDSEDTA